MAIGMIVADIHAFFSRLDMFHPMLENTSRGKNMEEIVLVGGKAVSPADLLGYYCRNRAFLSPYEPTRSEDFFSEDGQRRELELLEERENAGLEKRFFILRSSRLIGTIALSSIVKGAFMSCFLGYRLSEEDSGQGIMTDVVASVTEHAFSSVGLHRVEANVMAGNAASICVLERNGYILEGMSRKYLRIAGAWRDHLHYVALGDEWRRPFATRFRIVLEA